MHESVRKIAQEPQIQVNQHPHEDRIVDPVLNDVLILLVTLPVVQCSLCARKYLHSC